MSVTVYSKLEFVSVNNLSDEFICRFNELKMCKKMQYMAGNHRYIKFPNEIPSEVEVSIVKMIIIT